MNTVLELATPLQSPAVHRSHKRGRTCDLHWTDAHQPAPGAGEERDAKSSHIVHYWAKTWLVLYATCTNGSPTLIIHCDISSGNMLLEPLPNGWRAKVTMGWPTSWISSLPQLVLVTHSMANAAPEANSPHQHSPKINTFSFDVMLVEMCLWELPESHPEQQEEQIHHVKWPAMASLTRSCTSERSADRPSMSDIMELLDTIQV